MIDEMSKARGSAPGKQNLTECFKRTDFVRIQDLKRYLLLPRLLRCQLYLTASDTVTQQANACIANKCTA